MDILQEIAEQTDKHFEMQPLQLARKLSNQYKPPARVMTWCKRFLKLYYYTPVRTAFENNKISARYALDITDYIEYPECAQCILDACEGKFGNTEFRRRIKDIRNGTK